jgi:hypothetical protein
VHLTARPDPLAIDVPWFDVSRFIPVWLCQERSVWVCWIGGQCGGTQTSDHRSCHVYHTRDIEPCLVWNRV